MRIGQLRRVARIGIFLFAIAGCRDRSPASSNFTWSLGKVDDLRARARDMGCVPRDAPLGGEGAFACERRLDDCACGVSLHVDSAPRRDDGTLFTGLIQVTTEGCPDDRGVEYALALVEPAIASPSDKTALRSFVTVREDDKARRDIENTYARQHTQIGAVSATVDWGAGSKWGKRKIDLAAFRRQVPPMVRPERPPTKPTCDEKRGQIGSSASSASP